MFFIGAAGLVHCFFPTGIHLFKFNNGNARTAFEIYSKLTTKTPKQRYRRRSGVFIVIFEQIWNIVIVFPLLTLHKNGLNLLSVPQHLILFALTLLIFVLFFYLFIL